jgi:hypothetical protein
MARFAVSLAQRETTGESFREGHRIVGYHRGGIERNA